MTRYDEYIRRGVREHGDRFNDRNLAPQFVRYFNTEERVRVQFSYGETMTGRIGVTTGWRPWFILILRSSDHGSSILLDNSDLITAVQRGRTYHAITNTAW